MGISGIIYKTFSLAFPAIIHQADLPEVFFSARRDERWLTALFCLGTPVSCCAS